MDIIPLSISSYIILVTFVASFTLAIKYTFNNSLSFGQRTFSLDVAAGVAITGHQYRWPSGMVPFDIDPNLRNQQRVTDAIRHWESRTSIRFI